MNKKEGYRSSNPPARGVDSACPRKGDHVASGPLPRNNFGTTSGSATYQSDMVTGATRTRTRRQKMTSPDTEDESTYNDHDKQFRQPTTPEMTDSYQHLLNSTTTIPSRIQMHKPRLLQTQVPTFRGSKGTFDEFEHLRPISNRMTEDAKLQYFQSLLREGPFEFQQSLTITTETPWTTCWQCFEKSSPTMTSRSSQATKGTKKNTISQQKPSQTSSSDWQLSPCKLSKITQDSTSRHFSSASSWFPSSRIYWRTPKK